MLSKGWKLTVIALLAVSLSACMTDNGRMGTSDGGGIRQQSRMRPNNWDNQRNNNFMSMHNNTRMEMSERIANEITDMPEVDSANVLLTDKNAYVAVVLDNGKGYGATNTGRSVNDQSDKVKGNSSRSYRGYMSTDNNDIGDRMRNGMNRRDSDRNGTIDRMGRRGPDGAGGEDGVTEEVKERIAQKVKSVKPDVRNVYVSANPDFVNRMRGYANRFQNGQPLRGMIIEFNTMVERLFPDPGSDRPNR